MKNGAANLIKSVICLKQCTGIIYTSGNLIKHQQEKLCWIFLLWLN